MIKAGERVPDGFCVTTAAGELTDDLRAEGIEVTLVGGGHPDSTSDSVQAGELDAEAVKAMPDGLLKDLTVAVEHAKAQVHARVEHAFHIVKNLFRHKKLRYRGLAKATSQVMIAAMAFNMRRWVTLAST